MLKWLRDQWDWNGPYWCLGAGVAALVAFGVWMAVRSDADGEAYLREHSCVPTGETRHHRIMIMQTVGKMLIPTWIVSTERQYRCTEWR